MLKKLFFKYDKKVNEETNISYFTPTANIILINENESFETSAMIDSGSSRELRKLLSGTSMTLMLESLSLSA